MTSLANTRTAQNRTGANSAPNGLRFRQLRSHEGLTKVCQLFETLSRQPMTPVHWRSKYGQSRCAKSYHLVVEQVTTGRPVGRMEVAIVPRRRAGAVLRMGQVCDVMLDPEYRADIGPRSRYQRMNDVLRRMVHAPVPGSSVPLFMYGFPGIQQLTLHQGRYRVGLYLLCHQARYVYDRFDPHTHINLQHQGPHQGPWFMPGQWQC